VIRTDRIRTVLDRATDLPLEPSIVLTRTIVLDQPISPRQHLKLQPGDSIIAGRIVKQNCQVRKQGERHGSRDLTTI
jgi:hypothetical protein